MNYTIEEMEREMYVLKEQLAQRNAMCAEMRVILTREGERIESAFGSPSKAHKGSGYYQLIQHALSSGCGKDYFSREQVMPLVEALERLSRLGNEPMLGNSDGNVIAQRALTRAKEIGVVQ